MTAFAAWMSDTPLTKPGRVVIVAEDGSDVIGFATVDDAGEHAWLEDLWVEPESLGRGIGRLLWSAAVETMRAMGRSAIELEADPHAEPFYAHMGARTIGRRESTILSGRSLPLMRAGSGRR